MSIGVEQAIAYGLASIGLQVATPGDFNIYKLILFSRFANSSIKIVGSETGLYRPVQESGENRTFTVEAVSTVMLTSLLGWLYMWHPTVFDKSLQNTFTNMCSWK